MIGGKRQIQKSGDSSTNYQADKITIVNPDEGTIRAIVDKQLEARLALLTGEAFDKYRERCQDFSDGLVMAFQSTFTAHVERLREPSVQFSINAAQKTYGETGDISTKETLIAIIGKMCATPNNTLDRLYKDSIEVVGKLTTAQLNFLSLQTIIRNLSGDFVHFSDYMDWLKKCVAPFVTDLPKKRVEVDYLSHLGLGQYNIGERELNNRHRTGLSGLFQKGFSEQHLESLSDSQKPDLKYIIPCMHDITLKQVAFLNEQQLREITGEDGLSEEKVGALALLLNTHIMDNSQIDDVIIEALPDYKIIIEIDKELQMPHFQINPVGHAIAIINIEARAGETIGTGEWV